MDVLSQALPWIQNIVQEISRHAGHGLYAAGINNTAVILTHMLCFRQINLAAIERLTLSIFTLSALSIFCKRQRDAIANLYVNAVFLILLKYPGVLISFLIDDSDKGRSKTIKVLAYVFKSICKATGGYHNCQNIVFICAVTSFVTIPIGFRFYVPDPEIRQWRESRKKIKRCKRCLKRDKSKRCKRCMKKLKALGPKPTRNPTYKTRLELAEDLLKKSGELLTKLSKKDRIYKLTSVIADAAYMSPALVCYMKKTFPKVSFISQLRSNQMVKNKSDKYKSLKEYFSHSPRVSKQIAIRHAKKEVEYSSARLFIKSHGERMHVVAMRYSGEQKFRYIVCSDLTWRAEDIIRHYGLRWLVEVAIWEWKQYSGIGKGACLYGVEGASCVQHLSLLGVCLFLLHPMQLLLARKGQPLYTAGCLSRRMLMDFFCQAFQNMLSQDDPHAALAQLRKGLDEVMAMKLSKKHPSGKWYPEIRESEALQARYGEEQALKLNST